MKVAYLPLPSEACRSSSPWRFALGSCRIPRLQQLVTTRWIPGLALALAFGAFGGSVSHGQTLITNGVQTYASLTNTVITLSNRCELRVTAAVNPIPGCVINLASADACFTLP